MKKRILLLIIGILIVIISIVDVAFAFLSNEAFIGEGAKSNVAIDTCTKLQFSDKENNSINLTNTYPMADEMGLETTPYEFTISNICSENVGFNLYLATLQSNDLEDSNIKFAITNKNNEVLSTNILSNMEDATSTFEEDEINVIDTEIKGTHQKIYKIFTWNISLKTQITYKLYLWINKDATNATMGKSFSSSLIVKSYEREETLAEYLINNRDKTLIYHDGKCDYEGEENCNLEAGDYSYRYSGSSEEVKNYICLGETTTEGSCSNENDLYRIIGLFKNNGYQYEAKLIKYNSVAKMNFSTNNSNNWENSDVNSYLNNDYYSSLPNAIKNKIIKHNWQAGGGNSEILINGKVNSAYKEEISNKLIYSNYIGLIYVNDFGYATYSKGWNEILFPNYAINKNNNWIVYSEHEWLITGFTNISNKASVGGSDGSIHGDGIGDVSNLYVIRPSFYLTSDINLKSGEGNQEKPFILELNKE